MSSINNNPHLGFVDLITTPIFDSKILAPKMIKQVVNISVALLVLYNVLQAFKASKVDRKLYKRYNKYFMVIAVFLVLDNLFSFILNLIPFYQLFKLVIIVWMSVPTCTGTVFAYKFYINGLMIRYESRLDEGIEKIRAAVSGYFNEYYEKAQKKYQDHKIKRTKETEVEPLGIRNIDPSAPAPKIPEADASAYMEDGSDSGFSAIDSTIGADEKKSVSSLNAKWSNKSVDDTEDKQKEHVV